MIIDTHCHYNLAPLFSDDQNKSNAWESHWQKAQAHGVIGSVVVGTNQHTSRLAVSTITIDQPQLWAAIGIHPNEWSELNTHTSEETVDTAVRQLRDLVPHQKVVAIGETGLDYFHFSTELAPQLLHQMRSVQQYAFRQQIQLANEYALPLIIHVRDHAVPESLTADNAYWDVLSILREERPTQPFILHCVSGPLSYVKAALDLGAYIGIAGNVTYKNADHIRSLVTTAPSSRLLLETDAPYLPPVPYRGQSCEPWMISQTAEFLQDELAIDLEELVSNTCTLFPVFSQLVP